MTYDLDYTLGKTYASFGGVEGYEFDMFKKVYDEKDIPTNLFVNLLNNTEFKEKFKKVFEEYSYNVMNLDKINEFINHYKNNFTEMYANTQVRWCNYNGGTIMETYANAKNQYLYTVLPQIKKFFEERAKYAIKDMEEYLS